MGLIRRLRDLLAKAAHVPIFSRTILLCRSCRNPLARTIPQHFAFIRRTNPNGGQGIDLTCTYPSPITTRVLQRDAAVGRWNNMHKIFCSSCGAKLGCLTELHFAHKNGASTDIAYMLGARRVTLAVTSLVSGITHMLSPRLWSKLTSAELYMTTIPLKETTKVNAGQHKPDGQFNVEGATAARSPFTLEQASDGSYFWRFSSQSSSQSSSGDFFNSAGDDLLSERAEFFTTADDLVSSASVSSKRSAGARSIAAVHQEQDANNETVTSDMLYANVDTSVWDYRFIHFYLSFQDAMTQVGHRAFSVSYRWTRSLPPGLGLTPVHRIALRLAPHSPEDGVEKAYDMIQAMKHSSRIHPRHAVALLHATPRLRWPLPSSDRLPEIVFGLLAYIKDNKQLLTEEQLNSVCNPVMEAVSHASDASHALRAAETLVELGVPLTRASYTRLAIGCALSSQYDELLDVTGLRDYDISVMRPSTISPALEQALKEARSDDVRKALVSVMPSLIRSLALDGKYERASTLLQSLEASGDVETTSMVRMPDLLLVHASSNNWARLSPLLAKYLSDPTPPSITTNTLNACLQAAVYNKEPDLAIQLFSRVRKMNLVTKGPPYTATTLRLLLNNANLSPKMTKELWRLAVAGKHDRKIAVFNSALHNYASRGELEQAEKLFRDYVDSRLVKPNGATLGMMVKAACIAGDLDKARAYVTKAWSMGVELNMAMLAPLFRYLQSHKVPNGDEVALQMIDLAAKHGLLMPQMQNVAQGEIDLHGLNAGMARALVMAFMRDVRLALKHYYSSPNPDKLTPPPGVDCALCIVTGKGNNSMLGRSVLRPVVERYLTKELQPPITEFTSAFRNDGAIKLWPHVLKEWALAAESPTANMQANLATDDRAHAIEDVEEDFEEDERDLNDDQDAMDDHQDAIDDEDDDMIDEDADEDGFQRKNPEEDLDADSDPSNARLLDDQPEPVEEADGANGREWPRANGRFARRKAEGAQEQQSSPSPFSSLLQAVDDAGTSASSSDGGQANHQSIAQALASLTIKSEGNLEQINKSMGRSGADSDSPKLGKVLSSSETQSLLARTTLTSKAAPGSTTPTLGRGEATADQFLSLLYSPEHARALEQLNTDMNQPSSEKASDQASTLSPPKASFRVADLQRQKGPNRRHKQFQNGDANLGNKNSHRSPTDDRTRHQDRPRRRQHRRDVDNTARNSKGTSAQSSSTENRSNTGSTRRKRH